MSPPAEQTPADNDDSHEQSTVVRKNYQHLRRGVTDSKRPNVSDDPKLPDADDEDDEDEDYVPETSRQLVKRVRPVSPVNPYKKRLLATQPPKLSGKRRGPKPTMKSVMKNDMEAKLATIKEIESQWGKGFIQAFIPKVHRPLIKRGTYGKRPTVRSYENDPVHWLPSILKCILNISKLTSSKKWLKDAMESVVRYRIRHTGNRKPQLVTTDFDIIEDMLIKQWEVSYSFEIRYKHLLVNRKDQDNDEEDIDIDHILQVNESDEEDDIPDDEGDEEVKREVNQEDKINVGRTGITADRGMVPNTHEDPMRQPSSPPPPPPVDDVYISQWAAKQKRMSKAPVQKDPYDYDAPEQLLQRPQPPPPPPMYGHAGHSHGYGPPLDPWGRPLPFPNSRDPYASYGAYPPYNGGYGPPAYHGHHPLHQPSPALRDPSHGPFARHSPSPTSAPPEPGQWNNRLIKREESTLDEQMPTRHSQEGYTGGVKNEADVDEDIDAEIEAVQLELRLARLRAKRASQRGPK